MTRDLDINERRKYKTIGDDVPEHLRAQEIERYQFVKWIADYQLPIGLKLLANLHMYGGVTDPDSHIWKFKCTEKINAWNNPMACHLFQRTLVGRVVVWLKGMDKNNIT